MEQHGGARSGDGRGQRRWAATATLLATVSATALWSAFACSPNGGGTQFTTGSGGGDTGATTGTGGTGGTGVGGGFLTDGPHGAPIKVTPQNPTMTVQLPVMGQSLQFECLDLNTDQPAPDPQWSLDSLALGTINATGVFTPSGKSAGTVEVTCTSGGYSASTKLTLSIHATDNSGGLTQAQIDLLRGPPGGSDPGWQFLYPYNMTVFPRGILAPEVHMTSGQALSNAYYMHIVTNNYEYEGFFTVNPQSTQLQMSQAAWDALTNSAGGQKVDVNISKIYNGTKIGPIYRSWLLAPGALHGTIYYNTYDSPLAGNGAMMRIKGNSPTPDVLVGNCTVCHSISSDGSTAAAANHSGQGGVFDLTSGQVNPPVVWNTPEEAAFAALYPKGGTVLVTNGAPSYSWPPNTPGTSQQWFSSLYTRNGAKIPNSGIESKYAMSPVFSHDGTMLAFNDRSAVQVGSGWPGVLALMDYDANAQKFSNYRVLATPQQGHQLSWPAFTPDGKFVIYQDGVGEDLATWSGNTGKIYAANTQTGQVVFLGNLNGDGYMPQGARDENKNYEPTTAPVASGGYFWVMFTSRRTYGNKLTGDYSTTKRLWVSAIDINPQPGVDPTHPAFYIAGQELTSGNSRGFWALDPCKADGQDCQTGDECCNGFCNATNDPTKFVCGPKTGQCSDEFEHCDSTADCCDPTQQCINNVCTKVGPG